MTTSLSRDEPPIDVLADAWRWAERFAMVDRRRFVNIYVCSARTFVPVDGYELQKMNDEWPPWPRIKEPATT